MKPKILISLLFSLSFTGCASLQPKQNIQRPVSKVFHTSYEKVWRAVMMAIESYPIESEDNETGVIKTDFIRGDKIWSLPFQTAISNQHLLYSIQINLIRGQMKNKPVIQVQVLKRNFIQKGFIEDPVSIPSDGLQEKNILYRILREIQIDQNIAKNL